MKDNTRQFIMLCLLVVVASASGFAIGKIMVWGLDVQPRCSPHCSCIASAP